LRPVAWLEQGKVDYISPQLYLATTSTGQDYKKLCPWWSDVANKYNKYFYSSMSMTALQSTYKAPRMDSSAPWSDVPEDLHELKKYTKNGGLITENLTNTEQRIIAAANFDDSEAGLQIDWNRSSTKNAAPGTVFYSIKHLRTNGNFSKYLREQKFTSPALTPAIHWKNHSTLSQPTNVNRSGNLLSWEHAESNIRYAVYAIPNAQVGMPTAFTISTHLLGTTYTKQYDLSKHTAKFTTHKFAVAALDRYGNEFTPSYISTSVNETSIDHPMIRKTSEGISVELNGVSHVELYTLSGLLLDHVITHEKQYVKPLKQGVYILKINNCSYKIML
jgi:hypothetical protein